MKPITTLYLLALCAGCRNTGNKVDNNTKVAVQWIYKSPKPIQAIECEAWSNGDNVYTLIDAKGEIYYTGTIKIKLPKELK